MKRKSIVSFLLILIICTTFAQAQVIPPSPVSQEFAKYTTQEVSLYNGIPEISIPLYNIKLKGLSIPINLSYHASGIKFAQDDGDVGVGWVINPGYRISRTIYGYADELETMPDISTNIRNYEDAANSGSPEALLARDLFLSKFVPDGQFNYGHLDGEFDQFIFSTPNVSGGFIISDRNNKTITTTEESNLKIDYTVGKTLCPTILDGIKGFQIIDDAGNKYAYGEYNPQIQCNTEGYGNLVKTSWGLSEINTPIGEQVKFNYITGANGKWSDHIRSFSIRETNPNNIFIPTITSDQGGTIASGPGYTTFFSKEIITPNEKIIFNYDPNFGLYKRLINIQVLSSEDMLIKTIEFAYSQNNYHTFLDSLTIYDKNHKEIQNYRFDYNSKNSTPTFTCDHFGYYLKSYFPNLYFHQEFLDDPILIGNDQGILDYVPRNVGNFGLMPAVSREPEPTVAPDYFSLKRITYPTGGYTDYEYEPGKYLDGSGVIRSAGIRIKTIKSSDLIRQESLVQSYTYGINENSYGTAVFLENSHLESYFVKETAEMNYVCYPYNFNGWAQRVITYSTVMLGDIGNAIIQSGFVNYPCVTENYSSSIPSENGKTVYSFIVGYPYELSVLRKRISIPQEVYYMGSPFYVRRYRLWDKPRIERKVSYSFTEGQFTQKKEEVFEYEQTSNSFTGLKVDQSATQLPNDVLSIDSYRSINSFFNYGEYTIEIGKNILKCKHEYDYINGNTISNEFTYEYSNLLLSKEILKRSTGDVLVNYSTYPLDYPPSSSSASNTCENTRLSCIASATTTYNQMIAQCNTIPDANARATCTNAYTSTYNYNVVQCNNNYNSCMNAASSDQQVITEMQNKNMLSSVIEEQNLLVKSSGTTLIGGKIHKYKKQNGVIVPGKEYQIELSTPSTDLTASSFNASQVMTFHPAYKEKLTYDNYDTNGNIIQYHPSDNANTSFLWAYNSTKPVIQGTNVSYDVLKAAVVSAAGTSDLETYWNSFSNIATNSTQQAAWKAFNTNLRNNTSLANAQITTFTYLPLIGMTSQTDPNGVTSYYEYDGFGRLKNAKNKDLNILKQYEYHYQGQIW